MRSYGLQEISLRKVGSETLILVKEKTFDELHRRSKRNYQSTEQDCLKELFSDHETRNFWKYIGKIGRHNDRKPSIPMEVVDDWSCVYEYGRCSLTLENGL